MYSKGMKRDLITTGFTAYSTAAEVVAGHDLVGLRAIVTGASSGLGVETARALASAGAHVTLAVRDLAAGRDVAAATSAQTQNTGVDAQWLDLADRRSVASFLQTWHEPLDILINNAGVVTGGLQRTGEGWELQFATNHLGHFALANGLHAALAQAASLRGRSRVVSVSSTAHMRAGINFQDLQFERREYDPQIAYAQSKTANSLFAVEATRQWADDGIVVNAVNPGGIVTGLQRNFTPRQRRSLDAAETAGMFT